MNKFCIIANREKDEDLLVTKKIMEILSEHQKEVFVANESLNQKCYTDVDSIPADTDCAIVLGGDGTIIHAAHDLQNTRIPILGINLGTLGFLAEIEVQNLSEAFYDLFNGKYVIEERMMLSADILPASNVQDKVNTLSSLNDIVVTRSGFSRIIRVGIYVNGSLIQDFRGDGVIISTPTGSTGYNLSAGGPIVVPTSEMIVITPICPHSFNARSIVVSSTDTVWVEIRESKKTQVVEAIATIDGDEALNLGAKDRIVIKKSREKTKLIRLEQRSYFDLLRSKLGEEEV